MTSVEHKLLAVASLLNPDEQHIKQLQDLLPQVKDMDVFMALATQEGLAGLLYKNLLKSGLFETLSSTRQQKLYLHYHRNVRLNLLRIHEMKEVLRQLAPTDIRVILLKGIALIHKHYKDLGLRSMTDIDLWIRLEDFQGLADNLVRIGYERDAFYPKTFRKGPTTLDIKTHLLGADRIKSRTLLLQKGQEPVFHRIRPLSVEGLRAFVLDPYDQVIYLSLHAFKHNMKKLIWLVDIRELTSRWGICEWQAAFARAAQMGQEKTLLHVLFLLRRLLAYQPIAPNSISHHTDRSLTFLEKALLNRRIKNGALPEWAPLIFFSGKTDSKNQLRYALETLFPRADILRQGYKDFPRLKIWQLSLMRFFDLAGRAITSLLK